MKYKYFRKKPWNRQCHSCMRGVLSLGKGEKLRTVGGHVKQSVGGDTGKYVEARI